MKREIPQIIKEVGFDFSWDEKKVWELDISVEEMNIDELTWHFDIPFWSTKNGFYDLEPTKVINFPENHREEYERIINSDLNYPLDIMRWKSRWVLLDGLHRLVKSSIKGLVVVRVRKIPKTAIHMIEK